MRKILKKSLPIVVIRVLNRLRYNLNNGFHQQENRRKKAYGLYKPENPFPLTGMKHSLKNKFSLYEKTASFGRKIKNGFQQQENIFLLKSILPNFNHGSQQLKKDSEQKDAVSTRQKISFHWLERRIR